MPLPGFRQIVDTIIPLVHPDSPLLRMTMLQDGLPTLSGTDVLYEDNTKNEHD